MVSPRDLGARHGFYGPKQVVHFAPLKQCALIIIMWVYAFCTSQIVCINHHCVGITTWGFLDIVGLKYNPGITYVNILNDGRFNSSMWVLPKFVLIYGLIMPCMYCILGFCSMMNIYKIINYFSGGICPTSFNHGKGSKVPFHSYPKPHQVPFLKQGLGVDFQNTPWRAK